MFHSDRLESVLASRGGPAGALGSMLHYLERFAHEGAFGPDEVRTLTTAFDEAWKAIQDSGISLASKGQADAMRDANRSAS
jgi:hypothetical protein